jgi:hypothetical protein
VEGVKKTNSFLEDFIEMYKANPCSWQVKSKEYSDKNKKLLVYEKFADNVREKDPAANMKSVVKKLTKFV